MNFYSVKLLKREIDYQLNYAYNDCHFSNILRNLKKVKVPLYFIFLNHPKQ